MPLRVVQLFNPKQATGLFAMAVLVLSCVLYIIFDVYLDSVGREIAGSWIQSEAVNIQEGNLLSAITKNQRVLLSSQFVKGVKLVDSSTASNQSLIEFGSPFTLNIPNNLQPGSITSVSTGFLDRHIYYQVPERPDLILSFETQSDFLVRGYLVAVAAFMSLLTFLFVSIRKIEYRRVEAENRNRILLGEVAARVAHDIRSPLNTLNAVMETLEDLPPNSRRLLISAIQRIREIGLGIADQSRLAMKEPAPDSTPGRAPKNEAGKVLVFNLIEELLEEKRVQYTERSQDLHLRVNDEAHCVFVSANANELRRSLSNLIDNAIEASPVGKTVTVVLQANAESVSISIADNGKGIPQEVLSKIGSRGFSFEKPSGTGIGVYYAKRAVHAWGGQMAIESKYGAGTAVKIQLPKVSPPHWFVGGVLLEEQSTLVIVDDDPTVHAIWKDRVASLKPDVMLEHFFDPDSAMSWIVQNKHSLGKYTLLTDYNLNSQSGTGLSVLERFGLSSPSAIMVTSAFDDLALQERCGNLNVKIMPKSVMRFAPIGVG